MYPVWRPPQQRGFDPFGELYALRAELGRLITSALTGQSSALPDVDLEETDEGWTVTARLPGVAPDEVEIEVDDREVCIRAKSEAETSPDADQQAQASRRRRFEYRLSLPGDIDPDQVDATMDHGLLVVRLPRLTKSRRRQITIGRRGADTAVGQTEQGEQIAAEAAATQPAVDVTGTQTAEDDVATQATVDAEAARADAQAQREQYAEADTTGQAGTDTTGQAAAGTTGQSWTGGPAGESEATGQEQDPRQRESAWQSEPTAPDDSTTRPAEQRGQTVG